MRKHPIRKPTWPCSSKADMGAAYAVTQLFYDNASISTLWTVHAEPASPSPSSRASPFAKLSQLSVVPKTFHCDPPPGSGFGNKKMQNGRGSQTSGDRMDGGTMPRTDRPRRAEHPFLHRLGCGQYPRNRTPNLLKAMFSRVVGQTDIKRTPPSGSASRACAACPCS